MTKEQTIEQLQKYKRPVVIIEKELKSYPQTQSSRKERNSGTENMLGEMMMENSPNITRDTNLLI
jgi:hypothetical protein